MLNYINAELFRLVRNKKNFYTYLIAASLFVILVFLALGPSENFVITMTTNSEEFSFSNLYFTFGGAILFFAGLILIGAQVLYTVYLEDYSNRTLPTVLSTGLGKGTYVVSKMLVNLIYSTVVVGLAVALYTGGFFIMVMFIDGASFDAVDFQVFAQLSLLVLLSILAYTGLVHVISLFFQRSDFSIFIFIVLANRWVSQLVNQLGKLDSLSFLQTINQYSLSNQLSTCVKGMSWTSADLLSKDFKVASLTALAYIIISMLLGTIVLKFIEIKE